MKPRSGMFRLISVILILVSFFFMLSYLVRLEQQNKIQKEIEAQKALELLKLHKEQEDEKLRLEAIELENQRLAWIDTNRAISEPEVTNDDDDMEELLKKYYIAVPTPVAPWTDNDTALFNSPFGSRLEADLFTTEEDTPSFKILTYRERIFKSVFQYLDPIITEGTVDVKTDEKYKDTWKLYERLEDMLYPWIKPHWKHVFDITKSSDGNRFSGVASNQRGLVMCVGNHHFRHAVTSVSAIRDVLGSDIPIEIFYINEYDLDQEYIDYFSRIKNVKTRKIVDMVNNKYTQFGGWAMKPFAMLASSFTEVILMDADVFMFKKPETLFEDEGYIKTGALFFLDRTLFPRWDIGRRWLNSFLPTKSSYVSQSRWFKFTSAHEQESGIVVINKKQALFGLLSTCKMNDKRERDKVSYNRVHGDKETFWVGFEMVQTPYTFIRSYGAVLGGLGDAGAKETVCGNQLHLDANGNPYWWNGGILRDKNKWSDRYMKFSHYAQGEDWEFSTSCIKETDKIKPLGEKEMAIGEAYIKLDKSHGNKPSEEQEEEVEEEKPAEETIEEEEEEEEEE